MSDVLAQVPLSGEGSAVESAKIPGVAGKRTVYRVRGYVIPELWGPTMVAEYLEVRQSNLAAQVGLPEPVPAPPAPTIGGRLWIADEIREFKRWREEESE